MTYEVTSVLWNHVLRNEISSCRSEGTAFHNVKQYSAGWKIRRKRGVDRAGSIWRGRGQENGQKKARWV